MFGWPVSVSSRYALCVSVQKGEGYFNLKLSRQYEISFLVNCT